jgi:hypothetical protein
MPKFIQGKPLAAVAGVWALCLGSLGCQVQLGYSILGGPLPPPVSAGSGTKIGQPGIKAPSGDATQPASQGSNRPDQAGTQPVPLPPVPPPDGVVSEGSNKDALPAPASVGGSGAPTGSVSPAAAPDTAVQRASYQEPENPAASSESGPALDSKVPAVKESAPVEKDPSVSPPGELPSSAKTEAVDPPPAAASDNAPLTQAGSSAPPSVRLVNSKRITINYEIKDVGPSGVSELEVWHTQNGKTWTKKDVSSQAKPPYVIDVAEEGLHGFTLLARNGIGLAKETPKPGDLPQIWVEVDTTDPVVELTGIHAHCTSSSQNVVIHWKASDKNFGPTPITISYAEKADGPWRVAVANVPNTGRYEWPLPADAPARFYVRVEAVDLVGHIASAQTPKPALMDRIQPIVSILTVEGHR